LGGFCFTIEQIAASRSSKVNFCRNNYFAVEIDFHRFSAARVRFYTLREFVSIRSGLKLRKVLVAAPRKACHLPMHDPFNARS
jgi:hypothetical protein